MSHQKPKKASKCNSDEHDMWNRRSFIQMLGLVGGGTMAFGNTSLLYSKDSQLSAAINATENDNILVIIKLFGGNDGLNTVVPLNQYDSYALARPTLKVPQNELWNLSETNDAYGMPNSMSALQGMWGDGKMKIINSVGYDDPNKSHFKGTDIWASGQTGPIQDSGWLGRYFENKYPDFVLNPPARPTAIQIGNIKNITFDASEDGQYSFSVASIGLLQQITNSGLLYNLEGLPDCVHGEKLNFVRGLANNTYNYADVIYNAYNHSDASTFSGYSDNSLSDQLQLVSKLIKGHLGTKIYMVNLGGFDTHSNQANRQPQLLTEISDAIKVFYDDLGAAGLDDKVVSMTISEFGRRVNENGSEGTDHGTSGPMMLFGPSIEGNGMVGEHASLSELTLDGDLNHHTDFRNVYATLLKEWMCVDPTIVDGVILGQNYDSLDLGFSCASLSTSIINSNTVVFDHFPIYENNSISSIFMNLESAQKVNIHLYSLTGQHIQVIYKGYLYPGKHKIAIESDLKNRLEQGQYIYQIITPKGNFSKLILF